jgi:hypothetical protein
MSISTLTICDSPSAIPGMSSSSGATFTVGTSIMMRAPVIIDSAVAACPAPMFATSFSASIRSALRAGCIDGEITTLEGSVLCMVRRSGNSLRVEYQRR